MSDKAILILFYLLVAIGVCISTITLTIHPYCASFCFFTSALLFTTLVIETYYVVIESRS
jgi:hypothetical protein